MTKETTSFVYVTYILSTPEKVFEAITRRLIPLTQVHLHVVVGRRLRSDFCWGFRAR